MLLFSRRLPYVLFIISAFICRLMIFFFFYAIYPKSVIYFDMHTRWVCVCAFVCALTFMHVYWRVMWSIDYGESELRRVQRWSYMHLCVCACVHACVCACECDCSHESEYAYTCASMLECDMKHRQQLKAGKQVAMCCRHDLRDNHSI